MPRTSRRPAGPGPVGDGDRGALVDRGRETRRLLAARAPARGEARRGREPWRGPPSPPAGGDDLHAWRLPPSTPRRATERDEGSWAWSGARLLRAVPPRPGVTPGPRHRPSCRPSRTSSGKVPVARALLSSCALRDHVRRGVVPLPPEPRAGVSWNGPSHPRASPPPSSWSASAPSASRTASPSTAPAPAAPPRPHLLRPPTPPLKGESPGQAAAAKLQRDLEARAPNRMRVS